MTMIAAVLNPRTNELTMVNAGHMAPLLRRSGGSVEEIGEEAAGLPLGVAEGYRVRVVHAQFWSRATSSRSSPTASARR